MANGWFFRNTAVWGIYAAVGRSRLLRCASRAQSDWNTRSFCIVIFCFRTQGRERMLYCSKDYSEIFVILDRMELGMKLLYIWARLTFHCKIIVTTWMFPYIRYTVKFIISAAISQSIIQPTLQPKYCIWRDIILTWFFFYNTFFELSYSRCGKVVFMKYGQLMYCCWSSIY